jgi:hypothetical protein
MMNNNDVAIAEKRLQNHREREQFAFHNLHFNEVDKEFHTMYACIVQSGALPEIALSSEYYVDPKSQDGNKVKTAQALSTIIGTNVTITRSSATYPRYALGAAFMDSYASVAEFNVKGRGPGTVGAPIVSETMSFAECIAVAGADRTQRVGARFHFFPYDGPLNDAPGTNCYWGGTEATVDKPDIRAFQMKTVSDTRKSSDVRPHFVLDGEFSAVDCQKICDVVESCEAFVLRVDAALKGHCYMFNNRATVLPVRTGSVGTTFGYPSWGAGALHDCEIKVGVQSLDLDSADRDEERGIDLNQPMVA